MTNRRAFVSQSVGVFATGALCHPDRADASPDSEGYEDGPRGLKYKVMKPPSDPAMQTMNVAGDLSAALPDTALPNTTEQPRESPRKPGLANCSDCGGMSASGDGARLLPARLRTLREHRWPARSQEEPREHGPVVVPG